jgi:hypothetical protein
MFAITVQRSARHLSSAPWLGRPHGNRTGLSIAEHGWLQLRVHFVCDGNYVSQQLAEIHPV